MTIHRFAAFVALGLLLCVLVGLLSSEAHAMDTQKKGMDSLKMKEIDADKLPNRWEMGLGFGSVVVAFAVVKWL